MTSEQGSRPLHRIGFLTWVRYTHDRSRLILPEAIPGFWGIAAFDRHRFAELHATDAVYEEVGSGRRVTGRDDIGGARASYED